MSVYASIMIKYLTLYFALALTVQMSAQQTNGLFNNDSLSFNGYTLFAPINYKNTYLIDNCGFLVNEWESNYNPGLSAYLLPDGNLLRTMRTNSSFFLGGGSGGGLEIRDWDNDLVWQYIYSQDSIHHQHHDMEYLPNGNILLIAWEYLPAQAAIDAGRNPIGTGLAFWPDKIVEIKPIGTDSIKTVWEWHAFDHIIQDFDNTKPNYGIVAEHPELIDLNYYTDTNPDWLHTNGVDYNPQLDQIILSVRNYSEFWVIDHSTTTEEAAGHTGGNSGKGGDILYRWGNPQTYNRGTSADRVFYAQHDAHWIPDEIPGSGNIMVFNNGKGLISNVHSSIDVIAPPVDASGNYTINESDAFGPTELAWTYEAATMTDFYSPNISGAQRLPNGNTLICEGTSGHLFEVNQDGELLWDYVVPVSFGGPLSQGTNMNSQNSTFRSYRYSADYEAFVGKDLTPGSPVELNPIASECEIYETLTANENVNFGSDEIKIHPNPVTSHLNVENSSYAEIRVVIFDVAGRSLEEWRERDAFFQINLNNYQKGIYFINIYTEKNSLFYIKKIVKM